MERAQTPALPSFRVCVVALLIQAEGSPFAKGQSCILAFLALWLHQASCQAAPAHHSPQSGSPPLLLSSAQGSPRCPASPCARPALRLTRQARGRTLGLGTGVGLRERGDCVCASPMAPRGLEASRRPQLPGTPCAEPAPTCLSPYRSAASCRPTASRRARSG